MDKEINNNIRFINGDMCHLFPISKQAFSIAEISHRGQKRKFSDEDYIWHPVRVAESLFTSYMSTNNRVTSVVSRSGIGLDSFLSIAIMHDVFEDTKTKESDIRDVFTEFVIDGINTLSRKENENYFDFIMRIVYTPFAIIKKADIEDNMRDLKEGTLKDKYRLAHYVLKTELEKGEHI